MATDPPHVELAHPIHAYRKEKLVSFLKLATRGLLKTESDLIHFMESSGSRFLNLRSYTNL